MPGNQCAERIRYSGRDLVRVLLLLFLMAHAGLLSAQKAICGTDIFHQLQLQADSDYAKRQRDLDATEHLVPNGWLQSDDTIIIPVVFHIIWNEPAQNVDGRKLQEQIDILNADFRGLNADAASIPMPFKSIQGSLPIRFVIANRNPAGKRESGIVRIFTDRESFPFPSSEMKRTQTGGSDAWDSKFYLNIWVCNIPSNILGYATLPSQAGTTQDGVVINYRYIGSSGTPAPYNKGRTATHEVGHWLNLRHIWGDDGTACTGTDFVDDTPNQAGASSGCPSFPRTDACSPDYPGVMFMNYMDYTDDACMLMFSEGQAVRMHNALAGPRSGIRQSQGYVQPAENDAGILSLLAPDEFHCTNTFSPVVRIINTGSNDLKSLGLAFKINNLPAEQQQWNGMLRPGDSAIVAFSQKISLTDGFHSVQVYTSFPNGQSDSDRSNDTIRRSFSTGNIDIKALPFLEAFANDLFPSDGWNIRNPDGHITWERTTKASRSGAGSVYINSFDYNPEAYGIQAGAIDELLSPFFDLSNASNATLKFSIAAAQFTPLSTINNRWDTLQILVSTDCGISGTKLYEKSRFSLVTTTVPVEEPFIPLSFQWRTDEIDLSEYAGLDAIQLIFRSINHWENNIYIDDVTLTQNTVTGTTVRNLSADYSIYPNPSNGYLTLKTSHHAIESVEIIDLMGKNVFNWNAPDTRSTEHSMNLSELPKGIYILRMQTGNGRQESMKIVLQ
jgi:hypothetical protein